MEVLVELVEVASDRIFHTELLGLRSKAFIDYKQGSIRIKVAKGRDAGPVEARLIVEVGD